MTGLVALLIAPYLFYPPFLIKVICFCLFACAYKLAMGTAGLLSFGHAAFFGGAAYIAAHAAKVWGFPFEFAVLAGTVSAGVLGLAFGIISIRRHGIYFAMITLALAQLVYFAALQVLFTHSEDGIQGVPRGYLFGVDLTEHVRDVLHERGDLHRWLPDHPSHHSLAVRQGTGGHPR